VRHLLAVTHSLDPLGPHDCVEGPWWGLYRHVTVRSPLLTEAPDAALPDPNDIWQPDEVIDAVEVQTHDDLPVPEHSFTYKQAVGTTDTLQVKLPEATSAGDINVDLKSDWVIVRTTKQYAPLLMPSTVEADQPMLTWRCCVLD
jgi:hypothetical protein